MFYFPFEELVKVSQFSPGLKIVGSQLFMHMYYHDFGCGVSILDIKIIMVFA